MRSRRFRVWDPVALAMSDSEAATTTVPNGEVMQSVGMKAKDGTELFEGDICEGTMKIACMSGHRRGAVVYNESMARYELSVSDGSVPLGVIKGIQIVGHVFEEREDVVACT